MAFSHLMPHRFENYFIPGSKIFSREDVHGSFILQQLVIGENVIEQINYELLEDMQLECNNSKQAFYLFIQLQATSQYHFRNSRAAISKAGRFYLFYHSSLTFSLSLPANQEGHLLIIELPVNSMLSMPSFYPVIEAFTEHTKRNSVYFLTGEPQRLSLSMHTIINRIIHSPYTESVRPFFEENLNKLIDLVLYSITPCVRENTINYSVDDMELVYRAKEFIDAHLDHHFSIMEIAKKVGLNERKLKNGFKEVYKAGLYGYLKRQRLERAKTMLANTKKAVKEIARKSGYRNTSNFSAAFKKEFNLPPAKWRRFIGIGK